MFCQNPLQVFGLDLNPVFTREREAQVSMAKGRKKLDLECVGDGQRESQGE